MIFECCDSLFLFLTVLGKQELAPKDGIFFWNVVMVHMLLSNEVSYNLNKSSVLLLSDCKIQNIKKLGSTDSDTI